MTREEKIRALVDEGGETREQAIESLINSGDIEEDEEDDEPSEYELERIAENVGVPFHERIQSYDQMLWLGGM